MKRRDTLLWFAPVLGAFLALSAVGCGDKGMPTQPLTPTPRPTQGPSKVEMEVTLSRTDPPAGVRQRIDDSGDAWYASLIAF